MANLKDLINAYGRACVRDGNPAWESAEGQALLVALESPVQNVPTFIKTEQMLNYVDWQAVGRIIEKHFEIRNAHLAGTTNWAAAIWKAAIKG